MLRTPMFAPWRTLWGTMLPVEMSRVDSLAERRRCGRSRPPCVDSQTSHLVRSEEWTRVLDGSLSSRRALEVLKRMMPLIRASTWPRWLLIEAALDQASRTGSLHLAALSLRTLIEELDSLLPLGRLDAELNAGRSGEGVVDSAIHVLRSRVLRRRQSKGAADLLAQANDSIAMPRENALQRAFDELGEFVHPNYGSHVLLVHPESIEAPRSLCAAFAAVYDGFFQLGWSSETDEGAVPVDAHYELSTSPFAQLADLALRSTTKFVSLELLSHAADVFRLQAEADAQNEALADAVHDEAKLIGASAVLGVGRCEGAVWPVPLESRHDRTRHSLLVASEAALIADLKRSRSLPDEQGNELLRRTCSAIAFSLQTLELKLAMLGRDAAMLLLAENFLGAALGIRAMLEHHAVAVELGKKLSGSWNRLGKIHPVDEKMAGLIAEAEKQVARVLATEHEPSQLESEWRALWKDSLRRHNALSSVQSIDKDEPGLLAVYGLLSHIVHGTICTGGDLLDSKDNEAARQHFTPQLLLRLSGFYHIDSSMDRIASATWVAHRFAALRSNRGDPLGRRVDAQRIPPGKKLKPTRDFCGSGTKDDPFRFRAGLVYHDAYARYVEQNGLLDETRQLHMFPQGPGDEVQAKDGRKVYFLNDALGSAFCGASSATEAPPDPDGDE